MNERNWTPYINLKKYISHNPQKPDVLYLQIADPHVSSETYNDIVRVYEKDIDGSIVEKKLPIRSHGSPNLILFRQWKEAFEKGLLNVNTHIKIKFWWRKSKRNPERELRDYKLIILD
ncbi:MAG: hypothetical protein OEW49_04755 [Nitrosopumilus sp.]|nr:hypothetical protein [Nitrosopumilus sp.]